MKPQLSIVIPCYNESENIPIVLEKFKEAINKSQIKEIELILVDNNSKDNTQEVLKDLLPNYPFASTVLQPIPGYGAAIYLGLKSATGNFIGWTHADLQTDPFDTIKALTILQKQNNPEKTYLKGKRYGRPFFDKFFEFGMSIFESLILRTFLIDINAQPNIFHNSFLDKMKNPPEDFSFDLYTYYLAKSNNYHIKKFPVIFPERIHGESAWNTSFQEKIKFIKRTLDFSFKLKSLLKNANNLSQNKYN